MSTKRITVYAGLALVAVLALAAIILGVGGEGELGDVRAATEGFSDAAAAEAAGYVNVNVDECVASPDGVMGHHFVNFGLLDLELDPLQPEILVYAPEPDGSFRLVAVEYAVPIEPWDAMYDTPPTVLGQELHANPVLELYVLHAWIHKDNPSGIFADWNPNLTCEV